MRSTILVLAAVATMAAADCFKSTAGNYYCRFPKTDALDHDAKNDGPGKTLEQYADDCDALGSSCTGFNTDGWLKNCTSPSCVSPQSECDLFVQLPAPIPELPPIVPVPSKISNGSTMLTVSPQVMMKATTPSADLTAAFARFVDRTFLSTYPKGTTGTLTTVTVTVENVSVPLDLGVDESYTLNVDASGETTITSKTVYGAYHGLETLSQLIQWSFENKQYYISCAPVAVTDAPDFTHRSILVDTSRHWHPLRLIEDLIDAMSYAKLNAVHWHIVDWQAYPAESKVYPKLWQGAWSEQERYTQEDMMYIVEYGRQRGIRVFPEIDTPGHAAAMCVGYPEICPAPDCPMPLNVANEETFTVLTGVFGEFTGGAARQGIFPDVAFHLGGDEVNTDCWTKSANISQWLKDHGLTADQGYEYFVNRTSSIALKMGRDPIVWEEVWKHFGTQLDKRIIIEAWLSSEAVVNATSHGYRAIWAVDGRWYLDGLSVTWDDMWSQDPLAGVAPANQDLVIGGSASMWSETVDASDQSNTIWPRAAAVSERLWSYHTIGFPNALVAKYRMQVFRCLLNRRGITAAPLDNPVARSAPPGPGSCFWQ